MKHILLASQYIGKEENPNNSGFKDSQFEADMVKFGAWQSGFAWCCCFVRMIFIKSYPETTALYKKLLSPSTRTTYNNLIAAGYKANKSPIAGSVVLLASYRSGIQQPTGHAAIVTEVLENGSFKTIEGNGSANGSRNGDHVVEHVRGLDIKPNGLNILGFFEI